MKHIRLNIRLTKEANKKLRSNRSYHRGALRERLVSSFAHIQDASFDQDTSGRDHSTTVMLSPEDHKMLRRTAVEKGVSVMTLVNACLLAM
jgi:hypothetical protein